MKYSSREIHENTKFTSVIKLNYIIINNLIKKA